MSKTARKSPLFVGHTYQTENFFLNYKSLLCIGGIEEFCQICHAVLYHHMLLWQLYMSNPQSLEIQPRYRIPLPKMHSIIFMRFFSFPYITTKVSSNYIQSRPKYSQWGIFPVCSLYRGRLGYSAHPCMMEPQCILQHLVIIQHNLLESLSLWIWLGL